MAAIQNEFKQPNEAASKIEQKTSLRNQSTKYFRCDDLHNLKLCPFINKECFYFAKIRDTQQKFAEKTKVIINHQAFFQCNFRNYPG